MSRIISMKGAVHGSTAVTTIPATPVAGVAYRNAALAAAVINSGLAYSTIVDSAALNEILFRMAGLMDLVERGGILEWSPLTNYAISSITKGSDGLAYQALLASGPDEGAGVKDCAAGANPTFWQGFGAVANASETVKGKVELATTAEAIAGTDTERAVTPAGLAAGLTASAKVGYPDFSSPTNLTSGTTYTASVGGWVFIEPTRSSDGVTKCYMTINGASVHIATPGQYNDNTHPVAYVPIMAGDVYTYTTPAEVITESYKFYPNR